MILKKEERIHMNILNKFPQVAGKFNITRPKRIFVEVNKEIFKNLLEYCAKELGFSFLCTITGLDLNTHLEFNYHLANNEGILLTLKLKVLKDKEEVESIVNLFNGSVFYERELVDMFGAKISGLPEGRRYPLPDWWPKDQHPLRKEWKQNSDNDNKTEVK